MAGAAPPPLRTAPIPLSHLKNLEASLKTPLLAQPHLLQSCTSAFSLHPLAKYSVLPGFLALGSSPVSLPHFPAPQPSPNPRGPQIPPPGSNSNHASPSSLPASLHSLVCFPVLGHPHPACSNPSRLLKHPQSQKEKNADISPPSPSGTTPTFYHPYPPGLKDSPDLGFLRWAQSLGGSWDSVSSPPLRLGIYPPATLYPSQPRLSPSPSSPSSRAGSQVPTIA